MRTQDHLVMQWCPGFLITPHPPRLFPSWIMRVGFTKGAPVYRTTSGWECVRLIYPPFPRVTGRCWVPRPQGQLCIYCMSCRCIRGEMHVWAGYWQGSGHRAEGGEEPA